MSTFEGVIFAVVRALSEFFPLGADAHQELLHLLFRFAPPDASGGTALALGGFLALLVHFRHDWASMISTLLQVVIYRRMPKTLDEKIPLFMAAALFPWVIGRHYLIPVFQESWQNPNFLMIGMVVFGLALAFADYWGKKNRNLFDWSFFDAALVGVISLASLLPGVGFLTAALVGALLRNFTREASCKFIFYLMTPILLGSVWTHFQLAHSDPTYVPLSKVTFGLMTFVSFVTGLGAISAVFKRIQRKGFAWYAGWRIVVGTAAWVWLLMQA